MPNSAPHSPLTLARVSWNDPRAISLRDAMDVEMMELYREIAAVAEPGVGEKMDAVLVVDPDEILFTILVLDGETAVGHAALRPFNDSLEVKRVVVAESHRGLGIAKLLMREMESIARERGMKSLVLHTGFMQIPAIRLYETLGYSPIPYFRGYEAVPDSLCFEKLLPFG
ncbi:MAG: family N-acetyltransferase [Glaciihabitans sp.]|nr:family N-acetyltransferase [Glaciihabitans sp.]